MFVLNGAAFVLLLSHFLSVRIPLATPDCSTALGKYPREKSKQPKT